MLSCRPLLLTIIVMVTVIGCQTAVLWPLCVCVCVCVCARARACVCARACVSDSVAYPGIFFGVGVQQIQLRTEDREDGDLGAVAL